MRAMLTVTVLTMCSILCFGQVGNSTIMVLKLRSSSIAIRFFQIVAAHQTYSCKGNSQCIHPCLAPVMATDLILPKKLQVLNAISISQSTHFPLSPCMLILYLPISMQPESSRCQRPSGTQEVMVNAISLFCVLQSPTEQFTLLISVHVHPSQPAKR